MTEIDVLADQWRRSCWSDAWHGPSLGALLRHLDAETAGAHPIPGAHSIWEIVLHLAGWTGEVAHRLQGRAPAMPEAGDWPKPGELSEARWIRALEDLAESQGRLESGLIAFPAARLSERAGSERDAPLGTGLSYAAMVSGLLQHNAYHGGQISLLTRAASGARD